MKLLTLILTLIATQFIYSQKKIYYLVDYKENGNINYELFELYDSLDIYEIQGGPKSAFVPIDGDYNVYSFVAEHHGLSFDGTEKDFHDYLILKVNPDSGKVVDGFQYTMEWAEPPPQSDTYRVTNRNIRFRNNLKLDRLQLKLNEKYDEQYDRKRTFLQDKGIIKTTANTVYN